MIVYVFDFEDVIKAGNFMESFLKKFFSVCKSLRLRRLESKKKFFKSVKLIYGSFLKALILRGRRARTFQAGAAFFFSLTGIDRSWQEVCR